MALLETTEVSVRFGGNMAVNDVSLAVDEGTITGLIGPNGAGKTTTFNVITGLQDAHLRPGRVRRHRHHPAQGPQAGAAAGSPARSSGSRCSVRSPPARTSSPPPRSAAAGSRDRSARPAEEADAILDQVGLRAVADERADALPTGLARLVELVARSATRPRVLLLDEPASGLDEKETDTFAELLTRLSDDGMAVLIVEHDVPLVMRLCSMVYVLNFGEMLAAGTRCRDPAGPIRARRLSR